VRKKEDDELFSPLKEKRPSSKQKSGGKAMRRDGGEKATLLSGERCVAGEPKRAETK